MLSWKLFCRHFCIQIFIKDEDKLVNIIITEEWENAEPSDVMVVKGIESQKLCIQLLAFYDWKAPKNIPQTKWLF